MGRKEILNTIVKHVEQHPEKHETPQNLQDTYSGLGSPFTRCKECMSLVQENGITSEDLYAAGVRISMYSTYVEKN